MEKTQPANQQEIELIFGLPKIDHVFVDVICVYRLIIMNHPTLIMKRNHEKKHQIITMILVVLLMIFLC